MNEELNVDPTEIAARLMLRVLGVGIRTFRHPDDKYEHTISAVDQDWPEELEVNDSPGLD